METKFKTSKKTEVTVRLTPSDIYDYLSTEIEDLPPYDEIEAFVEDCGGRNYLGDDNPLIVTWSTTETEEG